MRRWKYGSGIIAETPQGTYSASISLGHQVRKRKVLKTLNDAKNWISLTHSAHINLASNFDSVAISDFCTARELLPDEITITEAVRYWLDKHPQSISLPISDAWQQYENAIKDGRINLRHRTFVSYRQAKDCLLNAIGDINLNNIDRTTIEKALQGKSGYSRNGMIRSLSAWFSWLVAERKLARNPCDEVKLTKVTKSMPQAFSVEATIEILRLAQDAYPDIVCGLALGFFAGLRPNEIERLRPSDISNGYILISPDVAKTSTARSVPIKPNLARWLEIYPFTQDSCTEAKMKPLRKSYVDNGGKWYPDGARHSYASYAYALCKDSALVASEMGHRGTDVFFRHYRALANEDDAVRYFSILPD